MNTNNFIILIIIKYNAYMYTYMISLFDSFVICKNILLINQIYNRIYIV